MNRLVYRDVVPHGACHGRRRAELDAHPGSRRHSRRCRCRTRSRSRCRTSDGTVAISGFCTDQTFIASLLNVTSTTVNARITDLTGYGERMLNQSNTYTLHQILRVRHSTNTRKTTEEANGKQVYTTGTGLFSSNNHIPRLGQSLEGRDHIGSLDQTSDELYRDEHGQCDVNVDRRWRRRRDVSDVCPCLRQEERYERNGGPVSPR
ncbi:uncharacterized protein B0H18DRAFT_109647 [Fomitopsis serialis]|uniref:uncharacterized protein n=1 Tax=Fomitopsis serialis TaxID=139415 RepID=UPI0020083070|nr:uncharacterized protein B0H18DRAFT_109647 [Neoantrodia serialis]KAH9915083.1 hypothetical protein B0H18DRAFT_109647 [Neoantrodia serialis]